MSNYAQTFLRPITYLWCQQNLCIQAIQVVLGSIFLVMLAQVAIPMPFTPVPLTLQTFGIAMLVLAQGKNKATLSVLAYLLQATAGLPVLAGGLANPLWMIAPRAGYLIGFAVAAYMMGLLLEQNKQKSLLFTAVTFAIGECVILALGTLGLSLFVGAHNAFAFGFLPFMAHAGLKVAMATSLEKPFAAVFDRS